MSTTLFRKKADRMKPLLLGAALALAGGVVVYVYGNAGAVLVAAGVMLFIWAYANGRRALVTMDAQGVLLRFNETISVPFKSIARADPLANHDMMLLLHSGGKVLVTMSKLDDDGATWLRKQLRKEVRTANK